MGFKIWHGGMIGAGAWSDIQLKAWQGVPNANIIALCDRHPERRDPVVERFAIPSAYNDFEDMLDASDLDFVDICTRPYSHLKLIKTAVERGIPIICQKPFCTNLSDAMEAVELCGQNNVRLMVNENFRWQAWYRKIAEILISKALGDVFSATLCWRERTTLPEFDHNQSYFADMPQLILYELGVHYLDTFRYLFGDPATVYARAHHISKQILGEDVAVINLGYPHMTAVIHQSWASQPLPEIDRPKQSTLWLPPPRVEIDGTYGTLTLQPDHTLRLFCDSGNQIWQFGEETRPASRVAAQQHFIDCLEFRG